MLKASTNKSSETVSHEMLAKYVPLVWMKWHAFFYGIASGEISPDDEKNEIELYWLLDDFKADQVDAISIHSGFPVVLYDAQNREDIENALFFTAKKIQAAYSDAELKLKDFPDNIRQECAAINEDCNIVLDLLNCRNSIGVTPEEEIFDFFPSNFINPLFDSGYNKCFTINTFGKRYEPDSSLFRALVNLSDTDYREEFSSIESFKLSPVPGRELSFYTLITLLALERNLAAQWEYDDQAFWANQMRKRILWPEGRKDAESDSYRWINYFINHYHCDKEYIKHSGFTEKDEELMKSIIGRPLYNEILEPVNLAINNIAPYPFNKIAVMTAIAKIDDDRTDTLHRLFCLASDETRYFLLNMDALLEIFYDENDLSQMLENNQFESYMRRTSEIDLIELLFNEQYELSVFDALGWLMDFDDKVDLSQKPKINRTIIKDIIESCVLYNVEVKNILKDAIEEELSLREQTSNSFTQERSVPVGQSKSILEQLIDYALIDKEGYLKVPRAMFARLLVKNIFVKPSDNYKHYTPKIYVYIASYLQAATDLPYGIVREYTHMLMDDIKGSWQNIIEACEGKLHDKKGSLKGSDLAKAFSDGDSDYSKRRDSFSYAISLANDILNNETSIS